MHKRPARSGEKLRSLSGSGNRDEMAIILNYTVDLEEAGNDLQDIIVDITGNRDEMERIYADWIKSCFMQ